MCGAHDDQSVSRVAVCTSVLRQPDLCRVVQGSRAQTLDSRAVGSCTDLSCPCWCWVVQTVQLSRKEVAVAHAQVAELAASVTNEKDRQLQQLALQVEQLEVTLATKEEVRASSQTAVPISNRGMQPKTSWAGGGQGRWLIYAETAFCASTRLWLRANARSCGANWRCQRCVMWPHGRMGAWASIVSRLLACLMGQASRVPTPRRLRTPRAQSVRASRSWKKAGACTTRKSVRCVRRLPQLRK